MLNNQSTNQCAAQSCSFTFTSSETMDFRGKARSKNNSSLERVDSRVQHRWRLRVMGSCPYFFVVVVEIEQLHTLYITGVLDSICCIAHTDNFLTRTFEKHFQRFFHHLKMMIVPPQGSLPLYFLYSTCSPNFLHLTTSLRPRKRCMYSSIIEFILEWRCFQEEEVLLD